LIHVFIHSGHGNPTSGTTYPFSPFWPPPRVTILLAQFAARAFGKLVLDRGMTNLYGGV